MTSWWQQKEKRMTPRVTLETLAAMMKAGFDEIDRRFGDRFTGIEARLERIELRLDQCAYRFEVAELSARVERLERKTGLTATT